MTQGGKIRILHYIKKKHSDTEIGMKFGVLRFAVACVKNAGVEIQKQEMKGCPYSVEHPLYAKYPEINAELIEFMQFARSQRLPVSRNILLEGARTSAESRNITIFKESSGYMQRFLRRNPIQ